MTRVRAVAIGIRAAFRAPDWIGRTDFSEFVGPSVQERAPTGKTALHARTSRRVAWLTLRILARLRPGRWKTSCLYRSAAECLALQALGVPARVVLGVNRDRNDSIGAHAWVEAPGLDRSTDEQYSRFHRSAAPEHGRL